MAIMLNNNGHWHDVWHAAITKHMPGRPVFVYPNIPDPDIIEYALVWHHPPGELVRYENLKAVMSLGSGVDHLDADDKLPDVPIFRLIDPAMAEDMALYTLYWTLHFQRQFATYRAQQGAAIWKRYPTPLAPEFRLCVLGLGAIGSHIARVLARNGFTVSGWSRSPKTVESVNCLHGQKALLHTLAESDVMVCCLPHNKTTKDFIDKDILQALKPGAHLINVSRGAVIHETDLLKYLNNDHLGGAALDVFTEEPLPEDSPFWRHPKVYITPHMSGATNPDTAARIIAKDITLFENGQIPLYPYKRDSE